MFVVVVVVVVVVDVDVVVDVAVIAIFIDIAVVNTDNTLAVCVMAVFEHLQQGHVCGMWRDRLRDTLFKRVQYGSILQQ